MFRSRLTSLTFVVIAAFTAIDILWVPRSNLIVDTSNYIDLAEIGVFLLVVYALGKGISLRLINDHSGIGRFIARAADGLVILVKGAALFIPLGFVGGVFMYLASGAGFPLMDGRLAAMDAALGFDWPTFLAVTDASRWLSAILIVAYHSVGPQIPLVFLVLSFTLREERLIEFVTLMALSSLLTAIGMVLVPAAGAYPHFNPPPEAYKNFTSHAGMWHYAELMKLRSGGAFLFIADKSKGLVTFPSYHTVLGIIIPYAFRDFRRLFIFFALLNAMMLVATLPEGGHHLVDVLAGLIIALMVLSVVRALERAPSRQGNVL